MPTLELEDGTELEVPAGLSDAQMSEVVETYYRQQGSAPARPEGTPASSPYAAALQEKTQAASNEGGGFLSTVGDVAGNVGEFFAKPVLDAVDIYQQGLGPGGRLPESVGERSRSTSETARNLAAFAAPAAGGAAAVNLATQAGKGVIGRAGAAGLGSAAGEVVGQAGEDIAQGQAPDVSATDILLSAAGGAVGQPVGEALGYAVPAAVRGLFRGGEQGRQGVQQAIDDAARFGTTPTVAQATHTPGLDSLESLLSKTPGGAGVIRKRVQETTDRVREKLLDAAQQGTSRALDAETAGIAVSRGVDDFVAGFRQRSEPLFEKVTAAVGADTPANVISTMSTLEDLTRSVAGAQQTSQRFTNPFIRGLYDDLVADAGDTTTLPFEALQRVRGLVGAKIADNGLTSDVPTGQLKRIYGAISTDLEQAAKAAGPDASRLFGQATKFYNSGLKRIDDTLAPLVRSGIPEKIFDSLVRGAKSGPTQIRKTLRSLTPEQQDIIAGTVIRRLGTARSGQQGAQGDQFSFGTFLTEFDKLDDAARDALFKRGRNTSFGDDLEALARYAERVRESSSAFANPSGTAGAAVGQTAGALSIGGFIIGNWTLPFTIAATALGANASARLMTSPNFVRWLAESTRLAPNGIAPHVGRLAGIIGAEENSDIRGAMLEFTQALDQASGLANAGEAAPPPALPAPLGSQETSGAPLPTQGLFPPPGPRSSLVPSQAGFAAQPDPALLLGMAGGMGPSIYNQISGNGTNVDAEMARREALLSEFSRAQQMLAGAAA